MNKTADSAPVKLGADIGGTFTDVVLEVGERRYSIKILTTYDAPERALLEGVSALLDQAGLRTGDVDLIVHGTTLATNALIERKGARTALLTTAGFRDVLEMGTESRFDQYDITMDLPKPLIPRPLRVGISERIAADGTVLLPLDEQAVVEAAAFFRGEGVESVAVAFLHSYANPIHEQRVGALLQTLLPHVTISLSCEVSSEMREYERFSTTAANAYVQPIVASYLSRLRTQLTESGFTCPFFLMLSSGGLSTVDTAVRFPVRLVESGPAGGAIFAAAIAAECGIDKMLALDVGGTTAKICFIDEYRPKTSQVFEVARVHRFRKGSGLPLRIPVIEMVEIGAGGGSIAHLNSAGRLMVGPHSAGSEPGPACYGRRGLRPTVTDADVTLGRIDPSAFAGGTLHLDSNASATVLSDLNRWNATAQELALGVSEIVDEAMSSAARVHAVEQGTTVAERTLVAFGGAAPLHAARIAEKLGIAEVIIPRSAGVGSAVGFLRAPVSYELSRSLPQRLNALDVAAINQVLSEMAAQAHELVMLGSAGASRQERRSAFARYRGQGYEMAIELPKRPLVKEDAHLLVSLFKTAYQQQYSGDAITDLPVEILTWRVTVTTISAIIPPLPSPARRRCINTETRRPVMDPASGVVQEYAVIERDTLEPGDWFRGPALVQEAETTTVVSPAFDVEIDAHRYIILRRRDDGEQGVLV